MDAYLTTDEAATLGAGISDLAALLALEDDALTAKLLLATLDIDSLHYQGRKYDESGAQAQEFPRIPYGTVMRNQLGLPTIGGIDAGILPPAGIVVWDWDNTANDGQGGAVVPLTVKMACLFQAASYGTAEDKRLAKIRSGLKAQAIGTASEQYASLADLMATGGATGLCARAARFLDKYLLATGQMI